MNQGIETFGLNPFPGLRPFNETEDFLFFGREGQISELINRLRGTRFLAVVGSSGSGKSSLIRAGLVPSLHRGAMTEAGSNWKVIYTRPGAFPIGNLARSLTESDLFEEDKVEDIFAKLYTSLNRSRCGLIESIRSSTIEQDVNILIVVDQFEEIFRYRDRDERSLIEAADYIGILLEAASDVDTRIHIVLTMRSDFLGECASFSGLTEAVNRGEYLIPRLNRDELQSAIVNPIHVAGGSISNRLVQKLLNCVAGNQDQLPILQHALMRTWQCWESDHALKEPIDLVHFQIAGEIEHSISRHASEIIRTFNQRQILITERVFKALTELGNDRREIRRPVKFKDLLNIIDCSEDELTEVVDAFRSKKSAFLTPTEGFVLYSDSVIDISHESLMRVWDTLQKWVQEESQSARIYKRLAETAVLYSEGRSGLYRDPDLQIALKWQEQNTTNEAWAQRYHDNYRLSLAFLEESRRAKEKEALEKEELRKTELDRAVALADLQSKRAEEASSFLRKSRIASLIMACLTLVAVATGLYAIMQQSKWKKLYNRTMAQNAELQEAKNNAIFNEKVAGLQTQYAVETASYFVDELIDSDEAGLDPESLKLRVLDYLVDKNRKIRQFDESVADINVSELIAELGIARSLIRLLDSSIDDKNVPPLQIDKSLRVDEPGSELEVRETITGLIQKSQDERIAGVYESSKNTKYNRMELRSPAWLGSMVDRVEDILVKHDLNQSEFISLRDRIRLRTLLSDVFQSLGRFEKAKEQRDALARNIKAFSDSPNVSKEDRIAIFIYSLRSEIGLAQIDAKESRLREAVARYDNVVNRAEQAVNDGFITMPEKTDEIRVLLAQTLHEMGRISSKDGARTNCVRLFDRSNKVISEISPKSKTSGMIRINAENYRYLADLFAIANPEKSEQYRLKTEEILNVGGDQKRLERTVKDRSRRAWLLIDRGDSLEANINSTKERLSLYKSAFDMFAENLRLLPNSRDVKRDISTGHERVGIVFLSKRPFPEEGDLEAAQKEFEAMLELKRELASYSDDWEPQLELAITYNHFCELEEAKGDIDLALDYYRKQKEILDRLFERFPSEYSIARNRLLMYWGLSSIFQMRNQIQESVAAAYICRDTAKAISFNNKRAPFITRMIRSVESRILELEAILSSERSSDELLRFPKSQRQLAIDSRLQLLEQRKDLSGAMELASTIENHVAKAREDQRLLLFCYITVAELSGLLAKESSDSGLYEIHLRYQEKSQESALKALQTGAVDIVTLAKDEAFATLRQGDRWHSLFHPSASYRAYAESVVNSGGYVGVVHDNGFQDRIDSLENLPLNIYCIVNVNLSDNKAVEDRLLEPLSSLVGLREIMLEQIPGLRNDQLAFLKGCDALQTVGLGRNPQIDGTGLKYLADLPELRYLYLGSTNFDKTMAESISGLESLYLLDINTSLVRDDAMIAISRIKSLRDLCLTNNAITDSGVQFLKGMDLDTLRLNETDVTDGCIDSLLELKSLRVLNLDGCSITDSGVARLVEINGLQELNLNNLDISLDALTKLGELYELEDLKIQGVPLVAEEISELKARLPFCNVDPTTVRFSERKKHGRKSAGGVPSVK